MLMAWASTVRWVSQLELQLGELSSGGWKRERREGGVWRLAGWEVDEGRARVDDVRRLPGVGAGPEEPPVGDDGVERVVGRPELVVGDVGLASAGTARSASISLRLQGGDDTPPR